MSNIYRKRRWSHYLRCGDCAYESEKDKIDEIPGVTMDLIILCKSGLKDCKGQLFDHYSEEE